MKFNLTKELLSELLPVAKADKIALYAPFVNEVIERYQLDTPLRIAHFIGQTAHESAYYNVIKENLNYSAEGLLKTFKKYFTPELATQYARQPSLIANRVYANRGGNGNEESGDGWKYSGKGILQITFKVNYELCGQELDQDFVSNPDDLLLPRNAVKSAGWYWSLHKLNKLADVNDILTLTKRINGGLNGLEERKLITNRALKILNKVA